MTYPAQSTFVSGASGSLWWKSRYDSSVHVCASQGRTVIKLAQQAMRRALPVDYYRLDGGRGSFNTRDLTADGIPGPNMQAALLWTVTRANVGSLIAPVAADFDAYAHAAPEARGMPLSQGTCAALIWVAQNLQPEIGAYEFPAFVPPTWRLGSPDDGPEVVTCFSPSVIPPTGGGGGASTPSTGGGGTFNPYDLSSFGAASNLGGMISTTTPPATPPARKSKAGAIAAAAVAVAVAAAAEKRKRKR